MLYNLCIQNYFLLHPDIFTGKKTDSFNLPVSLQSCLFFNPKIKLFLKLWKYMQVAHLVGGFTLGFNGQPVGQSGITKWVILNEFDWSIFNIGGLLVCPIQNGYFYIGHVARESWVLKKVSILIWLEAPPFELILPLSSS